MRIVAIFLVAVFDCLCRYRLISTCWALEAGSRPSFEELHASLEANFSETAL